MSKNTQCQTSLADSFARLRRPKDFAFEVAPKHIVRKVYDALNARKRGHAKNADQSRKRQDLCAVISALKTGDQLHAVTQGTLFSVNS